MAVVTNGPNSSETEIIPFQLVALWDSDGKRENVAKTNMAIALMVKHKARNLRHVHPKMIFAKNFSDSSISGT